MTHAAVVLATRCNAAAKIRLDRVSAIAICNWQDLVSDLDIARNKKVQYQYESYRYRVQCSEHSVALFVQSDFKVTSPAAPHSATAGAGREDGQHLMVESLQATCPLS